MATEFQLANHGDPKSEHLSSLDHAFKLDKGLAHFTHGLPDLGGKE